MDALKSGCAKDNAFHSIEDGSSEYARGSSAVMLPWIIALLAGVGAIAWGAEAFAEHLGKAAVTLGVSSFALALLLAGAEPEELATALGEVGELAEVQERRDSPQRVGSDLLFVLLGIAAMTGGAMLLVEAVRRISHIEATQTKLGLTIVGFATGFELVVLAWSASRRAMSEAVVAGVVGSFRLQPYGDPRSCRPGASARAARHPSTPHTIACYACIFSFGHRPRRPAKGLDPCTCHGPSLGLRNLCPLCSASLNFLFLKEPHQKGNSEVIFSCR